VRPPAIPPKCGQCVLYTDSRMFCAQLADDEQVELSGQSRTLSMKRGDTLGDSAISCWPIVAVDSGVLSLQHLLQDGRKTITTLFMKGDIIDLRDLSNRNRGALIALGNVKICRLSPKIFEQVVANNPKAQKIVWHNLRDQAFRAIDHSADIAKKQALEKVASFVIECHHRQDTEPKNSHLVKIPLRRIDLAEYLGMQPETVSRCFKTLQKRGILEAKSLNLLHIIDDLRLQRIANGEKEPEIPKSPNAQVLKSA